MENSASSELKELREAPQLEPLLTALAGYNVRYIIFGTVGLIAYGAHLKTGDLDICFALDTANLERLAACLTELKAKPRYVEGFNTLEECESWNAQSLVVENFDHLFQTGYGDLDLVPYPYGPHGKLNRFNYDSLSAQAVTKTYAGITVQIAGWADLVASKLSAQRVKDLTIMPELERIGSILEKGLDSGWPTVH